MKRSPLKKVSDIQKERNNRRAEKTKEMHSLFKAIWDEREDEQGNIYCFETGIILPGYLYRSRTDCYHHVLEKGEGSYPQYWKTKENIIIIHPEVHAKVGTSVDKCPRIKEYREKLLEMHYKNLLKKND